MHSYNIVIFIREIFFLYMSLGKFPINLHTWFLSDFLFLQQQHTEITITRVTIIADPIAIGSLFDFSPAVS